MRGIMENTAALCIVALLLSQIEGATYFSEPKQEIVHGRPVFYCEYNGLRLLPMSKFKDYDACRRCTCSKGGRLDCADIASRIIFEGESVCMPVTIGCRNLWVLKSDSTKKCPKKKIPPHGAVGK